MRRVRRDQPDWPELWGFPGCRERRVLRVQSERLVWRERRVFRDPPEQSGRPVQLVGWGRLVPLVRLERLEQPVWRVPLVRQGCRG